MEVKAKIGMRYSLGSREYVEDYLPYGDIHRFAWKGTITEAGDKILESLVIPAGEQLKILYLNIWTQQNNGQIFVIRQTAQTGDLGGAPAGVVDYPMLEAAGAQVIGPVELRRPIHVLEGSVTFELQDAEVSGADYVGLAYWGILSKDQPRPAPPSE